MPPRSHQEKPTATVLPDSSGKEGSVDSAKAPAQASSANKILEAPSSVSLENLLAVTPEESRSLVRQAYEFAEHLHSGQKRKSGKPYIFHPLTVATYLADLNMDGASVAAGLLHDVLEDTEMTAQELEAIFPESVVQIVQGVTKISKMKFETTREAQVENLRIMILAMAQDIRVVIVKLCDRLHNMQTLKHLSPDKRVGISQETLDIYAPLANRLGIASMKSELEDHSMRWLYPEEYRRIQQLVAKKRKERQRMIDEAIGYLREYLESHFPDIAIHGRPKHFYSIFHKMRHQGLTFEQLYDLTALRIICKDESECYEILGHIHAIWPPIPGRFKDYIGMPKKNMYRSLHTTVIGLGGTITEIQIRTREMHRVAEFGIAAHWAYKEGGANIQNDERLAWLRQLTEWITDPNEPEGFLEALKQDPFADRVLCFTPRGDVIELPAKATPIDFAYAIHTKVGEQCIGAKINGRMVNLRTQLSNGDVVEILTAKNGHPSRDWLDYVVTGRARQKIKHWLKARNIDEWVEMGRRSMNKLLQDRGHQVSQQELDQALSGLLDAYKMQSVSDLLVEIGFGSISAHAALARANPNWSIQPKKPAKKTAPKKKTEGSIYVEGAEGAAARIAQCCRPIPGDDIVAYITRGRGITVHSTSCRNIVRARKHPEEKNRLLPASWSGDGSSSFAATIHVESEDRNGLLNDISGMIAEHNIFIKSCHTNSDLSSGKAILTFDLNVKNASQLDQLLASLTRQRGIISARRRKRSGNGR